MPTGKQIFVRSALTIALPFILIWSFFATLFAEMKSAFWYAWSDVRGDFDSYRREMRWEDY